MPGAISSRTWSSSISERPVEAARGDDLVVDVDRVLHRGVRPLAAPGGQDEQQPDGGEHQDQDQECAHVSLSSQSRL